jgi:hypothetical protein
MVKPSFEAAIATGVDLGDLDGAAGADGGADQRRAAMAGDVEAGVGAALHVQVLSDAAGDVGGPADVTSRLSQRRREVNNVHAIGGGEFGQRDHAASSVAGWPYLKASWS